MRCGPRWTRRNYLNRLNRHLTDNGHPISVKGFAAFIMSNKCLAPKTMTTLGTAVRWYKYAVNLDFEPWTPKDWTLINALLRSRRHGKPTKDVIVKNRGAIDLPMFNDMIRWLNTNKKATRSELVMLTLCWGTGLRTNEMMTVQMKDFVKHPEGHWELHAEKMHDSHWAHRAARLNEHRRVHESITYLLDAYAKKCSPDTLLAEGWQKGEMNRLIKLAAAALDWDDRISWSSVHCLRHGLAVTVGGLGTKDASIAAVRAHLGHCSDRTAEACARPNVARAVPRYQGLTAVADTRKAALKKSKTSAAMRRSAKAAKKATKKEAEQGAKRAAKAAKKAAAKAAEAAKKKK